MQNISKLIIMAGLTGFTLLTISAIETPKPYQGRNLKVLPRNISDDDLDNVMNGFEDALGVKCEFCHSKVMGKEIFDYAADSKGEKEITRNMMRMTIDINKKHFQYTPKTVPEAIQPVTCFTCHNGKARPAVDSVGMK